MPGARIQFSRFLPFPHRPRGFELANIKMDHIPLPTNPCNVHIDVPYLSPTSPELRFRPPPGKVILMRNQRGSLSAVTETFLNFPKTAGFDTVSIADGFLEDKTFDDVLCFIQSWCFFGLLISTMRLSGIEVDHEDLIKTRKTSDLASSAENETLISTAIFPKLLRKMEMHSRPGTIDEETIQTVYNESLLCLRRIMIFLRDLNLSRDIKSPLRADLEPKSATPSLRDRIILSVYALGDFLHYALMLWLPMSVTPAEPEWGKLRYVPFLKERLIDAGWCRSEANLLDDQPTGLSSLYYMSFIDRKLLGRNHGQCPDDFTCDYENLKSYETLHSDDCPGTSLCTDIDVTQFQGPSVQQIISEGSIPVVTVEVDRVRPESEKSETPMPGRMILPDAPKGLHGWLTSIPLSSTGLSDQPNAGQYVAFSHVWQE